MFLHATGVEKTNGFEKRAICCGTQINVCRAVCSRRPPPRPGWRRGTLESTHPVCSERRRPSARSLKTARTGLRKWVRLRGRRRSGPSGGAFARTGARCENIFVRSSKRDAPTTPCYGRRARTLVRTYVNDPSAGSPTDTLLRLLRPLPQIICPTSQPNDHGQADHGTHPYRSLTGTIGRSDGRCVQRAGT